MTVATDYIVKVTNPGNLLPTVINREISKEQAELIGKLLEATDDNDEVELEMLGLILTQTIEFKTETA